MKNKIASLFKDKMNKTDVVKRTIKIEVDQVKASYQKEIKDLKYEYVSMEKLLQDERARRLNYEGQIQQLEKKIEDTDK